MDKFEVKSYNMQLFKIYCLEWLYLVATWATIPFSLSYLKNEFLFWVIIFSNLFSVFLFKPWKNFTVLDKSIKRG